MSVHLVIDSPSISYRESRKHSMRRRHRDRGRGAERAAVSTDSGKTPASYSSSCVGLADPELVHLTISLLPRYSGGTGHVSGIGLGGVNPQWAKETGPFP